MNYFRKPKTTGERRAVANATQQGVAVRGRRNFMNLPTEWDDKPKARKARCDRHKKHRS
jgi:hypothetical protein